MIKNFILLKIMFSGVFLSFSQLENGAIFHLMGDNTLKGELLNSDSVFTIKLVDNSIHYINKNSVVKALLPNEITLFNNGKYNLKKGFSLYTSFGINRDGGAFDFLAGYQIDKGFEAGFGFGFHENSFSIPIPNNNFNWFFITSYPFYISGKYFFIKDKLLKPYAKILVGLNNNQNDFGLNNMRNGLLFETGAGIAFSGRKKARFFFEVLQYNTHVKGNGTNEVWDWNTGNLISSNEVSFNIWVNKIMFNFGVFFHFLE